VRRRGDCQKMNSTKNELAVGTMESEQGQSGKKAHRRNESLVSVSTAPDVRYSVTDLRRNDDVSCMNPATHVIWGRGWRWVVQRR
jgi:hypothetical protein